MLEIPTPREVTRAVRGLFNFEVQPEITIQEVLADLAELPIKMLISGVDTGCTAKVNRWLK